MTDHSNSPANASTDHADNSVMKINGVIARANMTLPEKEKAEPRSLKDLSKALQKTRSAVEGQLLVDLFIEAAGAAIVPHLDPYQESQSYTYLMNPIIASANGLVTGLKYNEADIRKTNLAQIKEFTKRFEKPPEQCVRIVSAMTNKPSQA